MKIIGITGKSGSGKSTLAKILSDKMKCSTINIDKIGHKATEDNKIKEELCQKFGNQILGKDQKIDRKKLGSIVFSDKEKMDILTDITWGYMQDELDKILKNETGDVIILEWALLPISKYWEQCDVKILMKSDDVERKNRVIERDNISEEYFMKRDSNAMKYDKYVFDYVLENDYKLESLKQKCKTELCFTNW